MPKAGEKTNVLTLSDKQLAAYRRYLVGKRLASRLLRTYSVKEACRIAGITSH